MRMKTAGVFVCGVPGSGKTQVAMKVAEHLSAKLVAVDTCLNAPVFTTQLARGNSIEHAELIGLIYKEIRSVEAYHKGYVVDDLHSIIGNIRNKEEIQKFFGKILDTKHHLIFIKLIGDSIKQRRQTQKIDIATGIIHQGDSIPQKNDFKKNEDEDDDNLNEESNVDDDQGEQDVLKKFPKTFAYKPNLHTYEKVSFDIVKNLISPYESIQTVSDAEFQKYAEFESDIQDYFEDLSRKNNSFITWIEIDADQYFDDVVNDVIQDLNLFNFSFTKDAACPIILDTADLNADEDMLYDSLKGYNMKENEPRRDFSPFGLFDPVEYYCSKNTSFKMGHYSIVVVYKTFIYTFINLENRTLFCEQPEKFIDNQPKNFPPMNISLRCSSNEVLSRWASYIADFYKITLIDINAIILDLLNDKLNEKEKHYISETLLSNIKGGHVISPTEYVELIRRFCDEKHSSPKNLLFINFPLTMAQYDALSESEFSIDRVVSIQAESSIDIEAPSFVLESQKSDPTARNIIIEDITSRREKANQHFDGLFENGSEKLKKTFKRLKNTLNSSVLKNSFRWAIEPYLPRPRLVKSNERMSRTMRFGPTKNYCPVALVSQNMLVSGNQEIQAEYKSQFYQFSDLNSRELFMEDPYKYLEANLTPPPARICLVGAPGSGKSTFISHIKKHFDIPVVDINDYIPQNDLDRSNPQAVIEYEKKIVEFLDLLYTCEPYLSMGFVLEGFPCEGGDLKHFKSKKRNLDAIIALKCGSSTVLKRMSDIPQDRVDELTEIYEKEAYMIESMKSAIDDLAMLIEFENERPFRLIAPNLTLKLKSIINQRSNIFTSIYEIEIETYQNLIQFGIAEISRFGKYCPVELEKSEYATKNCEGTVLILANDQVFMIKEENVEKFKESVSKFLDPDYTTFDKLVRLNILVVGQNNSGKTTLSKEIVNELNMVYVNVDEVLEAICGAKIQENQNVRDILMQGGELTQSEIVRQIEVILKRGDCKIHGCVLDGFPDYLDEIMQFEKLRTHFHAIIHIETSASRLDKKIKKDIADPFEVTLHEARAQKYNEETRKILEFFSAKYDNVYSIDGSKSAWEMKTDALKIVKKLTYQEQLFVQRKCEAKPVKIKNVCISKDVIVNNCAPFFTYCPVSFVDQQELIPTISDRSLVVLFWNMFYNFSTDKACQKFIANPDRYVGLILPSSLPKKVSQSEVKSMFPIQLELKGYCPVTFQEGPSGFSSIVDGALEFCVEYEEKLYSTKNETQLEKFMKQPWKYNNLILPAKLPPKVLSIPTISLPIIGYLEQTIATQVTNALLECGKLKPKVLGKSIQESAVEFVALYLKTNNPETKAWIRENYKKKFRKFTLQNSTLEDIVVEFQRLKGTKEDLAMDPILFDKIDQVNSPHIDKMK